MKKVFVKTNNVKRFITMMNNLQNRAEGVPGMGLVYGEPGLGKTQAIKWWAFKNDAILIRCNQMMSARWLLKEILDYMSEIKPYSISDSFDEVIRNLILTPRVLIVDEVDYLTMDKNKSIEILRDIHDKTNIPVVLVGMTNAHSRLKKFSHLYDRLSEIVKFERFSKADIKTIVKELSEIELTDCAIKYISNLNRFRQIVKVINKAETIAKANGLSSIDEILIKEAIQNETENSQTDKDSE